MKYLNIYVRKFNMQNLFLEIDSQIYSVVN